MNFGNIIIRRWMPASVIGVARQIVRLPRQGTGVGLAWDCIGDLNFTGTEVPGIQSQSMRTVEPAPFQHPDSPVTNRRSVPVSGPGQYHVEALAVLGAAALQAADATVHDHPRENHDSQ